MNDMLHNKNKPSYLRRMDASQFLIAGFAALIFMGAFLLNLPVASRSGESVGFLDALFTATSAVCVTGQVVVNTAAQWTLFGRAVILALIQVGGLGVMTVIALAMMILNRQISLRDRLVIQASFCQEGLGGMVRLVRNVLKVTLVAEALGALVLAAAFYLSPAIPLSPAEALASGIFHSVSASCNAGFDIVGDTGMMPYASNVAVNLTLMLLIVGGGIGYPVWIEVADAFGRLRRREISLRMLRCRLSVHTKMVFSVTCFLLLTGAALFLALEWRNPATLGPLPVHDKVMAVLFQSTTLRTAGYNTISQAGLYEASQFLSCLLMFVGGSPAGTAGGIKTAALGVIFFSMLSALRGRNRIEAFRHELPLEVLQKALTVATLLAFVVLAGTMILCFTERGSAFPRSLFVSWYS